MGEDVDGERQKQSVISFADAGGNQVSLYFDARTNLLTRYEALGDDFVYGDTLRETAVSDYHGMDGGRIQETDKRDF